MLKTLTTQWQLLQEKLSRNLWKAIIGALVSRAWSKTVPLNIEKSEFLTRVILSPYHVKKNKILRGAFRAPSGSDEVSVSRRAFVSPWLSKAYGKRWVQRPYDADPKIYKGLAFISVDVILNVGSEVVDSRKEYLGHADIKHGITQNKGTALAPDIRKELDERLDKIVEATTYIQDKNANSVRWSHTS